MRHGDVFDPDEARASGPPVDAEGRPHDLRAELVEMIPALRAFARSFCRNATDADDLVQETLLKGIANMHRYQPGTNMKSWLFTILRNTFYTRIRKYNRESPAAEGCVSGEPLAAPAQEWRMLGQEVTRAVQDLPDRQREVLILISVLGISYIDAAEICDCAVGTVKSRLNRARQRLVERLGDGAEGATGAKPPREPSGRRRVDWQGPAEPGPRIVNEERDHG